MIKLEPLSAALKSGEPACCCCGYSAEWILALGRLERLFCERCLLNALLDAIAFAQLA